MTRAHATATLVALLALAVAGCSWDYGRFDPPPTACGAACDPANTAGAVDPCSERAGADRTTGPATLRAQYHEPSPRDDHTYDLRPTSSTAYPFAASTVGDFSVQLGDERAPRHLCVLGGAVFGQLDANTTWADARMHGPGGAYIAGDHWYVVDGLRVDNVPTGLTLRGHGPAYVRNAYMTSVRDVCVDDVASVPGFIEDSLFDSCNHFVTEAPLSGVTAPEAVGAGQPLVLDGVLIRLVPMPNTAVAPGAPPGRSHGGLWSSWPADRANHLVIRNTLIEIDTPPNGITYPPTAADPWPLFPDGTECDNVTVVFVPTEGGSPVGSLPPFVTVPSTCHIGMSTDGFLFQRRENAWLMRHGYAVPTG